MPRARYSRWDGSQEPGPLDAADILRQMMDELLEHGNPDQALRRLMQHGFTDGRGRDVAGLRDLVERARAARQRLAREAFSRMHEAITQASPEQMARARQMLSELNDMAERHRAGEDVTADFERFMHDYGDMVPGHPENIEQLLADLARQVEAAEAMLASMTPGQRAKLAELSEAMIEADGAMRFELSRLAGTLEGAMAQGSLPLGLTTGPGSEVVNAMSDLSDLEQLLAGAPSPGALAEVDIERARELLGDDDAQSLQAMSDLVKRLREAGLVEQKEGRMQLTPRGLRHIGDQALADLYRELAGYRAGQHPVGRPGLGQERAGETKPYEWGDPFNLSIERTLRNAVARQGPGSPVRLTPDDFEIERTESLTRSATVIMLDLSLSMPMRDNFVAAKKMAMALHALISSRFPTDYLGIVGFSRAARRIAFKDLPEVSWDYDWGTNIQHGLLLARRMLSHQRGTKQVIMVTDGEPTAHWPPGATEPVFAYPPAPETVDATLAEVVRCTKEGIRLNTFALDATGHLRHFVEQVAKLNRGRAFFTTPSDLGGYVLHDFLESRHTRQRRSSRPA